MEQQTYLVRFDNVSAAEANRYASELREMIVHTSPEVKVERRRDDPRTQDFGATLVLILGTSSVTALAQAIGNWLQRRRGDLSIEWADGKVTKISGTNLPTSQQLKLLNEAFSQK